MIDKRIFIIGSPRSGTTLLQNSLLRSDSIFSFPETHFFYPLCNTNKVFKRLHISNKKKISNRCRELGITTSERPYRLDHWTYKYWISKLVDHLDSTAISNGKRIWIEKTPMHLHYIPIISKYVPNAYFIHTLRSGKDVIASIYNYSTKHPDIWGERSLEQCISRWNSDIVISKQYVNTKKHIFVVYEKFIQSIDANTKDILKQLDIKQDISDFTDKNFDQTVLNNEPWKQGVRQDITSTNDTLFKETLSEKQQTMILQKIQSTDLSIFS
ncbi:sulfotransferase [Reichenbachiella carrageenanivorans]|uniref:Sulfotransferase n=1 Tax=Reichenbachiella carrageenanivorans TaxID=2979869 RepID=A0ABY6D5K0_9BACT|nr:sulfotransferase [Reichenbachiella carrageenanivorans]UXX81109.1 sulfotransferase [Reichenbachiella carrageenanivorans]